MMYTITPLKIGEYQNFEKSRFTYDKEHGKKIEVALIVWLLKSDQHCILVDSGPPLNPSQGEKHHLIMNIQEGGLASELKKKDVNLKDIDIIILTHLHWDHAYNLELFPSARIFVQQRELEYAINPLPLHQITYETNFTDTVPYWAQHICQYTVLNGNNDICDGIKVLLLPGHTPGLQGVLVDTTEGLYLIASDFFPLYENIERSIPNGIHVDLSEWYKSLSMIQQIEATILPGHDIKVFERIEYGNKPKS